MRAIIYTRVSSDEQTKGTSLADQERRCRAYCAENSIEVLSIFREEGASAKTAERKQLLAAIEYCQKHKGETDFFVVFKLDRFARNLVDHYAVRKILKDCGVELRSVSEQLNDEDPASKFMEAVIAAASEYDNDIRTSRAKNGMTAKVREGIWPWGAPVGYAPNPKRAQGGKKTLPDVPDPATYTILQTAFKEFASGEHTQASFAARLDNLGLAAVRGKKTTAQFVQQMLVERRLKFYAGMLSTKLDDGEDTRGLHQAMITDEEYANILGYLHGKRRPKQRHVRLNPKFPLRGGTVLCSACMRPLTGSCTRGHGGLYPYYHCYLKGCELAGKGIQKDELESAFEVLLAKIRPTPKFIAHFKKDVIKEWTARVGQIENVRHEYDENKRALELKLIKIKELLEEGTYTRAEYKERTQQLENELLTIGISSNESKIEQINIELLLDEATSFLASLGEHWKKAQPDVQQRFQKLLYPDGISYTRGVGFGTARTALIFELSQQFNAGNYHLVRPVGFEPTTVRLRGDCSTN